ncbi:MAG TPA: metal-dependent hydrolase [Labilithrix sp.]|nr:metal-dependent hydrolase [Labilithrix sp.]
MSATRPRPEVRNVRFSFDEEVPRHWHGGKRSVTSFFDNLSVFFPEGERFFIESVKAHKHLIQDEQLLKEVALFCAQEGIHAREHDRYNAMLEKQGYPVEELELKVKAVLGRATRLLPKRMRLSATCALEHFTAVMADVVHSDPRLLEGAHPVMAGLWRWHAAEEGEHRAVAYDLYRAVGAPYPERVVIMLFSSVIFWSLVVQHQAKFMKVDGTQWSLEEWRALFSFLFIEPGGMIRMWRRWLDYFDPGFHPWKRGNRDLIERWKEEYAKSGAVPVADARGAVA